MGTTNADLLRGTLELMILKSITGSPRHGYGISEWIESATGSEFLIEEGTLYPALHRLEKRKLVKSFWGLSEKNRKAKFYELTEGGREKLDQDTRAWERHAAAVAQALGREAPTAS